MPLLPEVASASSGRSLDRRPGVVPGKAPRATVLAHRQQAGAMRKLVRLWNRASNAPDGGAGGDGGAAPEVARGVAGARRGLDVIDVRFRHARSDREVWLKLTPNTQLGFLTHAIKSQLGFEKEAFLGLTQVDTVRHTLLMGTARVLS